MYSNTVLQSVLECIRVNTHILVCIHTRKLQCTQSTPWPAEIVPPRPVCSRACAMLSRAHGVAIVRRARVNGTHTRETLVRGEGDEVVAEHVLSTAGSWLV